MNYETLNEQSVEEPPSRPTVLEVLELVKSFLSSPFARSSVSDLRRALPVACLCFLFLGCTDVRELEADSFNRARVLTKAVESGEFSPEELRLLEEGLERGLRGSVARIIESQHQKEEQQLALNELLAVAVKRVDFSTDPFSNGMLIEYKNLSGRPISAFSGSLFFYFEGSWKPWTRAESLHDRDWLSPLEIHLEEPISEGAPSPFLLRGEARTEQRSLRQDRSLSILGVSYRSLGWPPGEKDFDAEDLAEREITTSWTAKEIRFE